jgi:hypothetical protein
MSLNATRHYPQAGKVFRKGPEVKFSLPEPADGRETYKFQQDKKRSHD